jgi:4,4'-diaponeurosporenoate glycosyltransferase
LFVFSLLWWLSFLLILTSLPPSFAKQKIHPQAADVLSRTCILIPARNEEQNIAHLLASLKNQSPVREILVIDDFSSDATVAAAAAGGAKVLSLEAESLFLPEGWKGKNWALYQGVRLVNGEYYLFLDADTVLEDQGLLKIVSLSLENAGAPVSLLPEHAPVKYWELFCGIPLLLSLFGVSGGKAKGFFGPCIFTSAVDYQKAGGHLGVKDSIVDDVDLGRKYIRQGISPVLGRGKGLISFRMYRDGYRQMRQGWVKNLSLGATELPLCPVLALTSIATGTVTAILSLILILGRLCGVSALTIGASDFSLASGALLLYTLYALGYFLSVRSVQRRAVLFALTFPVAGFAFLAFWIESLIRSHTGASVSWKGRTMKMQ